MPIRDRGCRIPPRPMARPGRRFGERRGPIRRSSGESFCVAGPVGLPTAMECWVRLAGVRNCLRIVQYSDPRACGPIGEDPLDLRGGLVPEARRGEVRRTHGLTTR